MNNRTTSSTDIAIIGMAGRFPKARNIEEFWSRLCNGEDCISFFGESGGAGKVATRGSANRVNARGILEDADLFDAAFFDVKPKEAEVMDPQHRVFLEGAWEALEDAGYDSTRYDGAIGVFAGMSMNTYLAHIVRTHPELIELFGEYQAMLANDKDFLPTRVSYKLNLTGPSLNIQTACSTSLVAVCAACQHLLNRQCDMALAGAVSIRFPQRNGHVHQQGGIGSADGHCRPFDASASGTVAGEGVGIVVLKRLNDALGDKDQIYAVIKGFATNNDGANKVGYTAPSVNGQAEVIATAQAMAGVDPEDISYVEAHGTATPLGDPIEIEALKKAFETDSDRKNYCAIGGVKSNIGHLDAAAGVAGLIKTALALHHEKIPATVHFKAPNPQIDFANSAFFVSAASRDWPRGEKPRRAGVSSFGIGGTNAHVVLEERPSIASGPSAHGEQLLLLSARTDSALRMAAANLANHLRLHPELDLADVAHTSRVGRREFPHRRIVVCSDVKEAISLLEGPDSKRAFSGRAKNSPPPVVFMFPGQGAQHVDMGRELYEGERAYREEIDACAEILKPQMGFDLREVLFPVADERWEAATRLMQTSVTQPALFVIEYALARLWMRWGVRPDVMIGHSIGEYVAACLAGVFTLVDSLKLVAERGRLMQQQPVGAMLAVHLTETEAIALLNDQLSLAVVNAPKRCVISGSKEAIDELQRVLKKREIVCSQLQTSHAFHSALMESALEPFTQFVKRLDRRPPRIPFISNVSGTLINDEEAVDPGYWARHLRQTVRFSNGVAQLLKSSERIFLEVGPGQTLSSLVRQQAATQVDISAVSSLDGRSSDWRSLLSALGRVWSCGVPLDWQKAFPDRRRRVHLPPYPFERKRYFVEAAIQQPASLESNGVAVVISGRENAEAISAKPSHSPALEHVEEASGNASGKQRIVRELKALLSDLSGMNLSSLNGETFAELGFDSLFLTQVSLAIEKKLRVRVAFRELLEEFSTVDALAAHIDSQSPTVAQQQTDIGAIGSESSRDNEVSALTLPLTDAQRDMWFASQMSDAASCTFNECRLLQFQGRLNVEVLRSALQALIGRHEALRTTFSPDGSAQLIHSERPVPFTFADSPVTQKSLDQFQADEASIPFDLANGPLLRARLFRIEDEHHVLMLTIHHLVCDGSSFSVLLRELASAYSAGCGATPNLLSAPVRFSDYVRKKTQPVAVASDNTDEAYWLREFKEVPRLIDLPTDYPRTGALNFEGAREVQLLPAALLDGLRQLSARQGCTLFTTLLAGFTVLLRQLTGQRDLVVGVPVADRGHAGGGALVGHCITFLPVRTTVDEDLDFVQQLAHVRKKFLDAHEHRHFSFGKLVRQLSVPREGGRMPLVSVTLNVERRDETLDFEGLKTELAVNSHSMTNFDLNCHIEEQGSTLRVDFQYNRRLFQAETVRGWLRQFQTLLESVNERPHDGVGTMFAFPMVPLVEAGEKVHQRAWSVSTHGDASVRSSFEPPSTPAEQTVAGIWQDLLGIANVGVRDNFFELGGHSLLMIQVIGRIRGKFQTNVSLRRFFETPTVAGLAEAIEEQLAEEIDDMSEAEARNLLGAVE